MSATIPTGANFDFSDPVARWLITEAYRITDTATLVFDIAERLNAAGIPLYRLAFFQRTLHPELLGHAFYWRRGQPISVQEAEFDLLETPEYAASPVALVYNSRRAIRVRLESDEADNFPILADLRTEGATDYIILPIFFADGSVHALSVVADRAGGFSDAELDRLEMLKLLFARLVEIHALRHGAVNLLDAYVGHQAGERVLAGAFRRNQLESIRAVIWYADMRGFTRLSDRLPGDQVIATLGDFYAAICDPVAQRGGEVLKFIGDAVLAIFPLTDKDGAAAEQLLAERALNAAAAAMVAMAELNVTRAERGEVTLGYGIALHIGDVLYGNVGTKRRLDFTIIGPAVNFAARLEKLCATLGKPLLVSEPLARLTSGRLVTAGRHSLKDIDQTQTIYELAP